MNSDFTPKDTSLWSSGICIVLMASINFSVDCSSVSQSVSCSISQYLGTASCSFSQSFSQLYNQSFHQPVSQLQADKGGLYYHLLIMHCDQTTLSMAESQRVTYFKVSPHRKHKGTREIHEMIQYTPHKLSQSNTIDFTR